jgi:hypothetical protein
MMRHVLLLIAMSQMIASSSAQLHGVTESGATMMANAPAVNSSSTNREWSDVIQNVSGKDVTAVHVTFTCVSQNGQERQDDNGSLDALLQISHDGILPPGGVYIAKATGDGECSAQADAILYADGGVEGDKDKIKRLFELRNGAYKALSVVIPLLDDVASGKRTASEVSETLRNKIDLLSSDRTSTAYEHIGEGYVFGTTISLFRNPKSFLSTPSDHTADRQPLAADVARAKGVSLEQGQGFVSSNKYREWQLALKGHTTMPEGN